VVAFFGTVLPDAKLAERLLLSQTAQTDEELATQAQASQERRTWQSECNLRTLLGNAP
jgi:thioredoxin 1